MTASPNQTLDAIAALPVWRVEDLVVEYRKVECQAQSDGMCGG